MLILIVGVWFQDLVIQLGPLVFDFIALPFLYDPEIAEAKGFVSFANMKQLILPMVVLTTAALASHMRYSRSYALEYANSEFVKTARAKGADGTRVLLRHILRVAAVPLMTIFVFDVLNIFIASSLIIEQIFQIPGLGLTTYKSFINQDTPVILANTLLGVFIALFGYLLQDIAYVALDPRIDYGDRTGGA
jgi:peptide/nickel transport system permease protein